MHRQRSSSRSLQVRPLRKVVVLVPEDCAEGIRQFARDSRAQQRPGPSAAAPEWRAVGPSTELMVNPECRARCAVRDTGVSGGKPSHWTVTLFDAPEGM